MSLTVISCPLNVKFEKFKLPFVPTSAKFDVTNNSLTVKNPLTSMMETFSPDSTGHLKFLQYLLEYFGHTSYERCITLGYFQKLNTTLNNGIEAGSYVEFHAILDTEGQLKGYTYSISPELGGITYLTEIKTVGIQTETERHCVIRAIIDKFYTSNVPLDILYILCGSDQSSLIKSMNITLKNCSVKMVHHQSVLPLRKILGLNISTHEVMDAIRIANN